MKIQKKNAILRFYEYSTYNYFSGSSNIDACLSKFSIGLMNLTTYTPTPCQYPGPLKPKYIRFIVIGSGNVTVPLDGTPGILFLTCLPIPGNFAFYGNIQTLPQPSSCFYRIDIQI